MEGGWPGGACFLGYRTPEEQRRLPEQYPYLDFVASEGPMPDAVALDAPHVWLTMLRQPQDRTLSAFRHVDDACTCTWLHQALHCSLSDLMPIGKRSNGHCPCTLPPMLP